jgi:hypothetical protein
MRGPERDLAEPQHSAQNRNSGNSSQHSLSIPLVKEYNDVVSRILRE